MILLETFEQTADGISSAELVKQLQPKMNKTTVYRILQRLEKSGTLHSFRGKDGLKWYAKHKKCSSGQELDTHPHFQCRDCGKVECLALDVSIPSISNYKIDSAELLLIGQCKDCMSKDSL
ncbi:MAG: transcriptional repressor [Bacteroidota bacterium]